jgi:hypothetical protein
VVDFVGSGGPILKFVRVRLPQETRLLAFIGLRREAVQLIEPTQPDEMVETPGFVGRTTPREVGVLVPSGMVRGRLEVLVNVRVSDFLRQQPSIAVLHDAQLVPYGTESGAPPRRFRTVIVSLAQVIGVSEPEGTGNR